MASLVLEIPKEYGYVLAVASATGFVNLLHFFTTAKYRKASGVAYPAPYATEEQCKNNAMAVKFNCAQRAHSNFGENIISFLPALAISGLTYPVASAVLGATWVFGRVVYVMGYTSAGPKGRGLGFIISSLADLCLRVTSAVTAYKFITA